MTLPNLSGVQNNLQNSFPNNIIITQTLDRVDENIGDKNRLYFRYHWQNITIVNGSNFAVNNSYGPTHSRNYAIGYTRVLKPNLVNDFRVGLNTVLSNSLDYFAVNGQRMQAPRSGSGLFRHRVWQCRDTIVLCRRPG